MTAGVVWLVVGIALISIAVFWLSASHERSYLLIGAAFIVGMLVGRFGFSRLVRKNVARIKALSPHKERICVFAFQAVVSYLLVIVMMGIGYTLRHFPIPHTYVASLYLIIGVALVRCGIEYIKTAKGI
ncbi:MAG: hypothetical protein AB1483_12775 [Candidatus Zixiibacteriota bacterium]